MSSASSVSRFSRGRYASSRTSIKDFSAESYASSRIMNFQRIKLSERIEALSRSARSSTGGISTDLDRNQQYRRSFRPLT